MSLRRRIFKLLASLTMIAVVITAGYIAWLDWRVTSEFSGRKWDLPSHVFARPLELYPGASVSQEQLVWELSRLGYREVSRVERAGQYAVLGQTVELYARGFEFWDGSEPSRRLRLEFAGGRVLGLTSQGSGVALSRLEPLRIGGVFPQAVEDRLPLPLGEMPPLLVAGLIQVEDRGFFEHQGISVRGIARAALANLRAGGVVEGGSTLTQQLVKNFYLSSERSLSRKLQEVLMALLLEIHYDKEAILETYLNEVYLGQSGERAIHGMGMASWHYFRQPLAELEPHQIALLIGMLKGPSQYDPWSRSGNAIERRNLVLQQLSDAGMLPGSDASRYAEEALDVAERPQRSLNPFPAYMDRVGRELDSLYPDLDPEIQGLSIYTSLDPWLQHQLERRVELGLTQVEAGYGLSDNPLEAAAILTRIGTADLVAIVGGRDPRFAGFNRALDASRPVGSLVKPMIYLTALQHPERYTLATLIEDAPFVYQDESDEVWVPQNYDGLANGQVPLFYAMSRSLNLATARLGLDLGVETVFDTLKLLGVDPDWSPWPSYLLGAGALTPMEVSTLYQSIAADGFYSPLTAVRGIYDASGASPGQRQRQIERRVDPRYVHLIQYALQVVMQEGTGRAATASIPGRPALAGKTGTTNDQRDSWFAGFDGEYLGVFWVGRDDNKSMPLTGATGALKLWSGFYADIGTTPIKFVRPPEVEYQWVHRESGALTEPNCADAIYLPFIEGSAPFNRTPCRGGGPVQGWIRDILGI